MSVRFPAIDNEKAILSWPSEGPWKVRVLPHPEPLYRVETDPGRAAEVFTTRWARLELMKWWWKRRSTISDFRHSATRKSSMSSPSGARASRT